MKWKMKNSLRNIHHNCAKRKKSAHYTKPNKSKEIKLNYKNTKIGPQKRKEKDLFINKKMDKKWSWDGNRILFSNRKLDLYLPRGKATYTNASKDGNEALCGNHFENHVTSPIHWVHKLME